VIGADNKVWVKNMEISAYQINNVLRVYGEQFRRGRISNQQKSTDTNTPDKISISGARWRNIDITSNILDKIIQYGSHSNNLD
jgi:hypothetical protein